MSTDFSSSDQGVLMSLGTLILISKYLINMSPHFYCIMLPIKKPRGDSSCKYYIY